MSGPRDSHASPTCVECRKVSHKSLREAERHTHGKLRPYRCPVGSGWHLTHETEALSKRHRKMPPPIGDRREFATVAELYEWARQARAS